MYRYTLVDGQKQSDVAGGLSSTPYYIQNIERKLVDLEYKLNLILKLLENKS